MEGQRVGRWRGWLSWRWQDNGNPRRGGSSGRATRLWKEVWELRPRRRPAGLCCLIESFSLHIVLLSKPQIKRIPKSQPLPPTHCQLCPTVFVSHGESGGRTSEAQLYVREGCLLRSPGFSRVDTLSRGQGLRVSEPLSRCALSTPPRDAWPSEPPGPVINSASRENAENTHHLGIHVPAESAYIK